MLVSTIVESREMLESTLTGGLCTYRTVCEFLLAKAARLGCAPEAFASD